MLETILFHVFKFISVHVLRGLRPLDLGGVWQPISVRSAAWKPHSHYAVFTGSASASPKTDKFKSSDFEVISGAQRFVRACSFSAARYSSGFEQGSPQWMNTTRCLTLSLRVVIFRSRRTRVNLIYSEKYRGSIAIYPHNPFVSFSSSLTFRMLESSPSPSLLSLTTTSKCTSGDIYSTSRWLDVIHVSWRHTFVEPRLRSVGRFLTIQMHSEASAESQTKLELFEENERYLTITELTWSDNHHHFFCTT